MPSVGLWSNPLPLIKCAVEVAHGLSLSRPWRAGSLTLAPRAYHSLCRRSATTWRPWRATWAFRPCSVAPLVGFAVRCGARECDAVPPPARRRAPTWLLCVKRDVLGWLSDAWMSVGARTIQRCWWRTGCLPLSWSMELTHVHDDEPTPHAYPDIELDDDIDDVGELISGLGLGTGAMTAAEYVAIDEGEPTCAEPGADPTPDDADVGLIAELWRAPTTMEAVYDDSDPVGREARRTARAACEMLIGYARAVSVTPRDLCHLFDIRNPIIIERMERASPALNLNTAPPPRLSPFATPPPDTPRPRGRVLPGWMTQPSRRQQLLDGGVGAAMGGYVEAAEWMHV
ncbi:unnamed protein product [Closterium sp. Yama58-4]|nr:unnamed protein product [Closterium sp. Yama58-4]